MKYFSALVPYLLMLCWIISCILHPGSEKNIAFLVLAALAITSKFKGSWQAK